MKSRAVAPPLEWPTSRSTQSERHAPGRYRHMRSKANQVVLAHGRPSFRRHDPALPKHVKRTRLRSCALAELKTRAFPVSPRFAVVRWSVVRCEWVLPDASSSTRAPLLVKLRAWATSKCFSCFFISSSSSPPPSFSSFSCSSRRRSSQVTLEEFIDGILRCKGRGCEFASKQSLAMITHQLGALQV